MWSARVVRWAARGRAGLAMGLSKKRVRALTVEARQAWAVGQGINGALGNGSTDRQSSPVPIASGELAADVQVAQVACGWGHSAVRSESGDVYVFGRTHDVLQSLRFGRMEKYSSPILQLYKMFGATALSLDAPLPVMLRKFAAIPVPKKDDRSSRAKKIVIDASVLLPERPRIVDVKCGAGLTGMLSDTGRVFMLGSNQYGQTGSGNREGAGFVSTPVLGIPYETEGPVVQFGLGFRHAIALTKSGKVFTWGKGNRGQLGQGPARAIDCLEAVHVDLLPGRAVAIASGFGHCLAVLEDGRVFTWGKFISRYQTNGRTLYDDAFRPEQVVFDNPDLKVRRVWSGHQTNVALADDGSFYQWGRLSDQTISSNPLVLDQLDPDGDGPVTDSVTRITVHRPLKLPLSASIGHAHDLNICVGTTDVILTCERLDRPLVWDWNLAPVSLDLLDPDIGEFVRGNRVVEVSQGWEHRLFRTVAGP